MTNPNDASPGGEHTLRGVGATPRTGIGSVTWYWPKTDLPDPPPPASVDTEREHERFVSATEAAEQELESERERARERVGEEEAEVFTVHLQFLSDPQLVDAITSTIDSGMPAEHAVHRGFADPIEQFEGMDGRLAERADDLRDLRNRLIRLLTGRERSSLTDLPHQSVVAAERLTPSETVQLDPEGIAGIVTIEGGRTSHAAIIARSLGVPAVVGVGEKLTDLANGETVVVNGIDGVIVRNPTDETRARALTGHDVEIRHDRVQTTDGRAIPVAANLGHPGAAGPAADQGADGVGLFRTEFLFLERDSPPTEEEQYEAIVQIADSFPGERVVVRTLDIGGDKPVPYMDLDPEENGFLGARGIRLSLEEHADLFETQLRAVLRATADGDGELAVMFPLIARVEELGAARTHMERVAATLADEGVPHAIPELGVMVETPAAMLMADSLAEHVDFLSIGTNDLTQYVMAAARDIDRVSELHDPRHPAVLRAIDHTVAAAADSDAWLGICGEMAGEPGLTELLVGLGVDELSMSAVTIPAVKQRITELDAATARGRAQQALQAETLAEVREILGLPADGGANGRRD